jgi:hypothetical protein
MTSCQVLGGQLISGAVDAFERRPTAARAKDKLARLSYFLTG